MNEIIEQISNIENLYWAWEKAKQAFKPEEIWFDEIELAKFEINLENELNSIKTEIENASYRMHPIKPASSPKSPDENGPRARQMFHFSVRDQVAWLAVVNIIGPALDYQMPFWSYANRLYISIFFEDEVKNNKIKKKIKFGWYRHTTKNIYRKWNQTWPRYRKNIALTAKIMSKRNQYKKNENDFIENELTEEHDKNDILNNNELPNFIKIKYFDKNFWKKSKISDVYWAGIDLEKFFPKINLNFIYNNYKKYFPEEKQSNELDNLINNMLIFPIDTSGWNEDELKKLDLSNSYEFKGIPTGLFVAGFLSNVALLEIDKKIDQELNRKKSIAHFRFVDDHVILTDNAKDLIKWIKDYEKLLKKMGLNLNKNKTEPMDFKAIQNEEIEEIQKKAKLDMKFPTPLMTQTLTKVSKIMQTEFDLLDDDEEDQLLNDIEYLLITDFPDQELRKDTRVSWAASMLTKLIPRKQFYSNELYEYEEKRIKLKTEEKILKEKESTISKLEEIQNNLALIEEKIKNETKSMEKKEKYLIDHTINLLEKSINDNHDKKKLWKRAIEFCRRIGSDRVPVFLDLLETLEKKNIVLDLTKEYILSILLSVLSVEIINSYKNKINKYSTHIEKKRALNFLNIINNKNFLNRIIAYESHCNKFYLSKSIRLFRFVLIYFNYIEKSEINRNIEMFESELHKFFKNDKHLFLSFFWWLLKNISSDFPEEHKTTWIYATRYMKKDLNFFIKEQGFYLFLSLYPKKILENFQDCDEIEFFLNHEKHFWINDIRDSSKLNSGNQSEHIFLSEWVDWSHSQFFEKSNQQFPNFDSVNSEWTCLEILKQIALLLEENINNFENVNYSNDFYKIHPQNYKIKKILTNQNLMTWEKLKSEIKDAIILVNHKDFKDDKRFYPSFFDQYGIINKKRSLIYGLGALLIGLLNQSFEFSPYNNIPSLRISHMFNLKPYSYKNNFPISSLTLGILESCFSKKDHETRILKKFQNYKDFSPDDDTTIYKPEIFTINNLIRRLEQSQKTLIKFQITVQDHVPRQLVPINLMQLTKTSLLFAKREDSDDI